ncbi:carbohydrate ABC transporter permease [Paenibacillus harenae]|uniref:ABC-type glycerol-3-phosphate transport system permease component n=1 Tax=Paenibacillus harenae TaxID=306543 RepID=A0ABT9U4A9_PAEHA|nr:carbohydrate ABC transporter permease [Paenibacillus harenae]MDQ0114472.1 ABC-type glycerol-3-phosphate transport system permease component [Paenibacillus harenae]
MEHSLSVKGKRFDFGGTILYVLLTLFGLLMLAPLVYMVSTAFKPTSELFLFPPRFFVMEPTIRNFNDLVLATGTSIVPFSRYIFNSFIVSGAIVVLGALIAAMAAYPLSKHNMPFRKMIFSMIIFALMFAPQVTQIPQFLVINKLGIINTYFALILPFVAAPVGMFLMKQFADQIPDVLLEAVKIDGAGEWKTFWIIVIPMLKPALATFALISFIAAWNDPFSATIYTTTENMKTLPNALQTIQGGAGVVARVGTVAAASLLMTIPTILVFIISQKMVLETMAHSGIKE